MLKTIGLIMSVLIATGCVGCGAAKKDDKNDTQQSNKLVDNSANQQQGGITSAGDPTTDLIVSGQILHKQGVPQTLDDDFVFTPSSHATVKLNLISDSGDSIKTIKEIRFSHLTRNEEFFSLPLKFAMHVDSLTGSIDELFSGNRTYAIEAVIHSKSGDDIRVGDLITEVPATIIEPTTELEIDATGVEHCNSEDSGGVCSTIQ